MLSLLKRVLSRKTGPAISNRDFVTRLYERHGDGLRDAITRVNDHNVSTRARLGLSGGSTGNADCGFLHLLVKSWSWHQK